MSRTRVIQTSFRSGVLSPNMVGLVGTESYGSGLARGENIVVETMGGIKRRAGTRFIRDYGDVEYMRIFPFTFNRDQRYLIVILLEKTGTSRVDIYRDDIRVVTDLVSPYDTADKIRQLDFAQSADAMVLVQGDTPIYVLRRLGNDSDWDLIPAPIINPPQYDPNKLTPPVLQDMWTSALGYPLHCTFHQGRLWFAGSRTFPQNVWSSKSQDFFNLDLGSSDAGDSIQEALDTDYINPITGIFSARKLQLFTRGGEFINGATVLTPTSSYWDRQTDYGSQYDVPPLAVDGSTIFVDSTGRSIRSFTYADEQGGYDAPSISSMAEHLVKEPQRMGVLRGDADEASNFIYIVNIDGSMAVLNLSKAHQLMAWTEWTTQGRYIDIVTIDREAYILVQRWTDTQSVYLTHNNVQVTHNGDDVWYGSDREPNTISESWVLERIDNAMLVDSGALDVSLTATTPPRVSKNETSFFGVYSAPDGTGKVIIVLDGEIKYRADFLKDDPRQPYIDAGDVSYASGDIFSYNSEVRKLYFDEEFTYQWYMYTVVVTQLEDTGKNYIGGLTHLIGREVVSVLDGSVQHPQKIVKGDSVSTVGKTYPDGVNWRFDANNKVVQVNTNNASTVTTVTYNGITYSNPSLTEYGYLISGTEGSINSAYLQEGVVRTSVNEDWVTIGSAISSTGFGSTSGIYTIGEYFYFSSSFTQAPRTGDRIRVTLQGLSDGLSQTQIADSLLSNGFRVTNNKLTSYFKNSSGQVATPIGEVSYNKSTGKFSGRSYCISSGVVSDLFTNGAGELLFRRDYRETSSGSIGVGWVQGVAGAGDFRNIQESEVRIMVLTESVTNDGIASYPEANFKIGQVGLFFPVIATTMPITAPSKTGNLVNEPKRIVSVTTRYKDTQGVSVNGVDIPERKFGEEVFGAPPPLLTGIEKNRHLGYNRETSVTIVQNDPMPFTLLSMDIEINY